jgi:hypothetical protein
MMNSMVWYQPLIGPLPHDLLLPEPKKPRVYKSRAECLEQGRITYQKQAKERALMGFSKDEWRTASTASRILKRTPQAVRRQVKLLVADGLLEERIRPDAMYHKQWRIKDAVSGVRVGEQGVGHEDNTSAQGVSGVQVEVVNGRDNKGRFVAQVSGV